MNFGGRVVIVSGGTGGLGQAVVTALVAAGARVAVPYRGEAGWQKLEAATPGDALWGRSCDIAELGPTAAFVRETIAALGRLDGLCTLAGGYAGAGPLEASPADEWEAMLRINLQTTYTLCRAVLPHLLKTGGTIVTVGSRVVEAGGAGAAAYAVSKAGVHALTRALAAENRDRGVRVNAVVPGVIDTAANRAAMPKADAARWAAPADIAQVVLFLLSESSAPVSGALVPVYGRS